MCQLTKTSNGVRLLSFAIISIPRMKDRMKPSFVTHSTCSHGKRFLAQDGRRSCPCMRGIHFLLKKKFHKKIMPIFTSKSFLSFLFLRFDEYYFGANGSEIWQWCRYIINHDQKNHFKDQGCLERGKWVNCHVEIRKICKKNLLLHICQNVAKGTFYPAGMSGHIVLTIPLKTDASLSK